MSIEKPNFPAKRPERKDAADSEGSFEKLSGEAPTPEYREKSTKEEVAEDHDKTAPEETEDESLENKLEDQFLSLQKLLGNEEAYKKPLERFIEKYREHYVRREYPPEHERLTHLERFIDHEKIERMRQEATQIDWRDLLSPKKRKRILERREELKKEDRVLQSAREDGDALPDSWEPTIIGSHSRHRHHADGGRYVFLYDSYGNTYFHSPDMEMGPRHDKLYGEYVNLANYSSRPSSARPPSRILAESSDTVDSEKIKAEDCELIDPMAVPDPHRSYASAVMFNFFTGCADTVITWSHQANNQKIRKDGVYYLFDTSHEDFSNWNDHHVEAQFRELEAFLDDLDDEERTSLTSYIADTAVAFMGVSAVEDATSPQNRMARADFIQTLYTNIENAPLKETYKKELLRTLSGSLDSCLADNGATNRP